MFIAGGSRCGGCCVVAVVEPVRVRSLTIRRCRSRRQGNIVVGIYSYRRRSFCRCQEVGGVAMAVLEVLRRIVKSMRYPTRSCNPAKYATHREKRSRQVTRSAVARGARQFSEAPSYSRSSTPLPNDCCVGEESKSATRLDNPIITKRYTCKRNYFPKKERNSDDFGLVSLFKAPKTPHTLRIRVAR